MIIFFIEKLFDISQQNLEHPKNEKEADKTKLKKSLVKFITAISNALVTSLKIQQYGH